MATPADTGMVESTLSGHAPHMPPVIAASTQAIAAALEWTPWSRDLGLPALATLARFLEWREIPNGGAVFRQGDRDRFVCILIEGAIEIVKENGDEEERLLARFTAGKTFGELALIDGEPRSATSLAAEPSRILVLSEEKLDDLALEHPRLGMGVLRHLARTVSGRLRLTSGRLVELL
jgi:CRP/FNR family transcriptional regulator, cyclic AMP receptor protein